MHYICTQFQENISKRFQSYLVDSICILKFTKGHNSVKSVGGVSVLILCTWSDNALYLYQVLSKYLRGFQSYRSKHQGWCQGARKCWWTDERTDRWKTRSLYPPMPEAGTTKITNFPSSAYVAMVSYCTGWYNNIILSNSILKNSKISKSEIWGI